MYTNSQTYLLAILKGHSRYFLKLSEKRIKPPFTDGDINGFDMNA